MRKMFWQMMVIFTLAFVGGACGIQEGEDLTSPSNTAPDAGNGGSGGDAGTDGNDGGTDTVSDAGTGTTDGGTASDGGNTDAGTTVTDGGNTDAGTTVTDGGTTDAGTTTDGGTTSTDGGTIPAPVTAPGACKLDLSTFYVSGSPCGEIRGDLPGMSWTSGAFITDSDGDGYLEYRPTSIAPGTYTLTYLDRECPNEPQRQASWAHYGAPEQLRKMSPDARSFIFCNWWDAATASTVQPPSGQSPGCNIRMTVDTACAITGAGNMRNHK